MNYFCCCCCCCDKDTWQKQYKTWDSYFSSWFWGIRPVRAEKVIQTAMARVWRFCLSYLLRLDSRSGLSTPFRINSSSEDCCLGPLPRGWAVSWIPAAEDQRPSTGMIVFHKQTLTQCHRRCVFKLIIFANKFCITTLMIPEGWVYHSHSDEARHGSRWYCSWSSRDITPEITAGSREQVSWKSVGL